MSEAQPIQSAKDFAKDPRGLQARWAIEIGAAKTAFRPYQTDAGKLVDRFLDKRDGATSNETRVNLFTANVQTQRALLFGKTPRVDVERRFNDTKDDVARAAAEMLERLANAEIEDHADGFTRALGLALEDRLLVGLGNVRLRYEVETEQKDVPAQLHPETGEELAPGYSQEQKTSEKVVVEYAHWRDQLWNASRTYGEVRWWAFRVYMTLDDLKKRFGAAKAATVSPTSMRKGDENQGLKDDPWARAEVWEVWSREDRKVYWYAEGAVEILDAKDDPLQLDGFFPFPKPLLANATSDSFMPRPDFHIAADLYDEIDFVSTRITVLERAVKVVGVYDRSAEGVRRLLQDGFDNDLLPIDNWALFGERGGLKGQIDWLPIDQVVAALDKLRDYRGELVKLLYEVTGMSDLMRGEQQQRETATTSAIKAKFASTRLQAAQEEVARFAQEIQQLKIELIAKHCDDQWILDASNAANFFDAPLAQQAVQLIRSEQRKFRIVVKPESVAMDDWDALKGERVQFLQGLGLFLQSAAPIMQTQPELVPSLFELLKWTAAGFRGANAIEGVIDQLVQQLQQKVQQQAAQPPQEPPQVQAQKARAQADIQVTQVKAQSAIQTAVAKHQIDQQKLGLDQARHHMSLQQLQARGEQRAQQMAAAPPPQPQGGQP